MRVTEGWGRLFSQLKNLKICPGNVSEGAYFRNSSLGLLESQFLSLLKKLVVRLRSRSSTLHPED